MTQANMTQIQTQITNNPIASGYQRTQIDTVAQTISTYLNNLWAPAWNIVIVKSIQPYDTVLYAYSYKDHWMWINGVDIPNSFGKTLSYIIWKDYTCYHWGTISDLNNDQPSFAVGEVQKIQQFQFTNIIADVWKNAYDYGVHLSTQTLLAANGYAIVVSQDRAAIFHGYVCIKNTNIYSLNMIENVNGQKFGSYLMFQTR